MTFAFRGQIRVPSDMSDALPIHRFPLTQWWHRRYWRLDPTAQKAFEGLKPAVVVTGASEGIGLALAQSYARGGAALVLVARNGIHLEEAAASIVRANPSAHIASLALDLNHPDMPPQLDAALAANGLYADILINNAGVGLAGQFSSHAPEAIDALLALNIVALTRLCRHVLPGQLIRGRGGIINIASLGGYIPGPNQAVYYASKAYVLSLSEALASETSGYGVHVMAVAPGVVDTGFHEKMGTRQAWYRYLMPAHSPAHIALWTRLAFKFGVRVLVPGPLEFVCAGALRLAPHRLMVPLVALLLRPQNRQTES
jgi:uncharacterized protein